MKKVKMFSLLIIGFLAFNCQSKDKNNIKVTEQEKTINKEKK